MAKKPPRSSANDATAQEAPQSAKPRARPARQNISAEGPENISGALANQNPDQPVDQIQQAPGDAMASRAAGEPTDEDIRMRAYEMYLERGGLHGLDFDDWVRAERELRQRR